MPSQGFGLHTQVNHTHTRHTKVAWVIKTREQYKHKKKRWKMVPFGKQQQRKKLKRSRIWTVPCILILMVITHSIFSMWLCCLLWIFYQAITGTGLAWVCLSARTWRGAPLLDVDFPLLVFDLNFFAMSEIFSKFISRCRHLFTYILRCLYFAVYTNFTTRRRSELFFINNII